MANKSILIPIVGTKIFPWESSKYYTAGTQVIADSDLWTATVNHTSGATFVGDAANWEQLALPSATQVKTLYESNTNTGATGYIPYFNGETYTLVKSSISTNGISVTQIAITTTINTIEVLHTINNNSSNTPSDGYGSALLFNLKSSTTNDQNAGQISTYWTTAAHATRTSALGISLVNSAGILIEYYKFTPTGLVLATDGPTQTLTLTQTTNSNALLTMFGGGGSSWSIISTGSSSSYGGGKLVIQDASDAAMIFLPTTRNVLIGKYTSSNTTIYPLEILKTQNNASIVYISNLNSSTLAAAGFRAANNLGSLASMLSLGAGYTTSGGFVQDGMVLVGDGSGGVSIAASHTPSGIIRFYTLGIADANERLRLSVDNLGFGTTSFGTNASKVFAQGNGTAPTTSPANIIQAYSEAAVWKYRDGAGFIITV